MSEKNAKSDENDEIPIFCTFRGLRPAVFKKAHQKAKELELSGKVLYSDDWKKIMHQSWKEMKEEVKKSCPCKQPTDEKTEAEPVIEYVRENIQEELNNSKEGNLEQDTDTTQDQPSAKHNETEQTTGVEQERTPADETREQLDV